MATFPIISIKLSSGPTVGRNHLLCGALIAALLGIAGCAGELTVEVQNRQAAEELARLAKPPGSVYIGWRVFQDRCARCHAPDANGTGIAPDLLPLVRLMGARRFVGLVLRRYDWNLPPAPPGDGGAAMEALIEQIMQRQGPVFVMPARVQAHILDLYTYLSARAEGTQGRGRPLP
jgi:mono/diheme cytochrome c family protein